MPRTYHLLLLSLKFIAIGKPLIYETIFSVADTVDHIQSFTQRHCKLTWNITIILYSGLYFQKITEADRLALLFAS